MNPLLKLLIFVLTVVIAVFLYGKLQGSRSTDFNEMMQSTESPFPECPDTPNCIRISVPLAQPTSRLYFLTVDAIERLEPLDLETNPEELSIRAVFEIPVFGFRDDLLVEIAGEDRHHILHIRSASRTGYSDLGVNRRRVQKLVRSIRERL